MKFRETIFKLSLIPISLFILGSIIMGIYGDEVVMKWDLYSAITSFNLIDYRFYFSLGVVVLLTLSIFYAFLIAYRELAFGRAKTFAIGLTAVVLIVALILNLVFL